MVGCNELFSKVIFQRRLVASSQDDADICCIKSCVQIARMKVCRQWHD